MSWLGQVSLTKPTYRRIVLRCCSVPQAKPSPDYEYRISLRPHRRTLWAIPLRAHGILQAGRSRPRHEAGATGIGKLENGSMPEAISESAAQKVFARAGSRKPRSDQHQECSTTDNHGYRRLACRHPIKISSLCHRGSGHRPDLDPGRRFEVFSTMILRSAVSVALQQSAGFTELLILEKERGSSPSRPHQAAALSSSSSGCSSSWGRLHLSPRGPLQSSPIRRTWRTVFAKSRCPHVAPRECHSHILH
jgi:hypothetical protein